MNPTIRRSIGIISSLLLGIGGLFALQAANTENPPQTDDRERLPSPQQAAPAKLSDAEQHRPGILPDRVILTWQTDPSRSQAVTWRTDVSVQSPQLQFAEATPNKSFLKAVQTRLPTSTRFTSDLGEALYHSVNLVGLKPSTKYVYRLGDGVHFTEWYQFQTASDKPEPFRFIYFGDAQNELKDHWSRVIRQSIFDAPNVRFFLHAGDLIDYGTSDRQWGEWFRAGAWLNATIPSIVTPGNHEYTGSSKRFTTADGPSWLPRIRTSRLTPHWRTQFALPENGPLGLEETTYFIDYQGVRFVSLNSNERIEEQAQWLDQILQSNPMRWTILTFHHPIISPAKARDNPKVRAAWQPIIDKHRVDLVLQGHDHTYSRSGLILSQNVASGAQYRNGDRGTVYCVSVSGPKMYALNVQPWMQSSAEGKQLYQVISIDGDRLHYEAKTILGETYDVFELRKSGDRNVLLEREDLLADVAKKESERNRAIAAVGLLFALVGIAFGISQTRRGT